MACRAELAASGKHAAPPANEELAGQIGRHGVVQYELRSRAPPKRVWVCAGGGLHLVVQNPQNDFPWCVAVFDAPRRAG